MTSRVSSYKTNNAAYSNKEISNQTGQSADISADLSADPKPEFNLTENDHQFADKNTKRAMDNVSAQETKKAKTHSVIFMQKAAATKGEKQQAITRYEKYIAELQTTTQNFDEQDKAKLQAKVFKLTNKLNEIKSLSEQYINLITENFDELTKEKRLLEEYSEDLNEQNKQSIEELDELEDTLRTTKEKLAFTDKELTDYRDHALQQRLARSKEHTNEIMYYIYALLITNFYTWMFSTYGFDYTIYGHFTIIYSVFQWIIYLFLSTIHGITNTTDFIFGNIIKNN